MTIHLPALSGIILTYLLVFSRVGAMVMLLPAIGEMGVPSRVRLVLALAISFALTPQVQSNYPAVAPASTVALVIMIAQEVTAGVLVGAMARIIMSALQVAGYLIATQVGLAYAQTLDPTANTQGAVLGNFMSLLGTALIFITNMHHLAIGAIAGSYHMLPPGGTCRWATWPSWSSCWCRHPLRWASSWRRRSWCSALRSMPGWVCWPS